MARSQVRRLVEGLNRVKGLVCDCEAVEMIGQAFADEVFRVLPEAHPDSALLAINASPPLEHMIRHAAGDRADGLLGKRA